MTAKLNQPKKIFQTIEYIEWNIKQLPLLGVMDAFMIDYA